MTASASVTLLVQLWPFAGRERDLEVFEDQALALLQAHGGAVLQRVRRIGGGEDAYESHLIAFPDADAHQEYLDDPQRQAMLGQRDLCVLRTTITPVVVIE